MRKKILGFVFAAALLAALAVPLFGGAGTAQAGNFGSVDTPGAGCVAVANAGGTGDPQPGGLHKAHNASPVLFGNTTCTP